jgi:dienelactone hydrolase
MGSPGGVFTPLTFAKAHVYIVDIKIAARLEILFGMGRVIRRVIRGIALLATVVATGIAVLLCVLWLDHRRETTLLPPTGPYAVGRMVEEWDDRGKPELLAPAPEPRRLVAWIWYPAKKEASPQFAPYLPSAWRDAMEQHAGILLSRFLTRDLSRVHTHSQIGAEVAPEAAPYPVVLLRGGAAALVANYTEIAEDLASHGYVVVGMDAPYRTTVVVLNDGRVVERTAENNADLLAGEQQEKLGVRLLQAWSSDMSFAVDELQTLSESDSRFRNRLDLGRLGVMGHSLGGASALQFCHDDPRCKVAVDIDGAPLGSVVREGLPQAVLFLLSEHRHDPQDEVKQVKSDIASIYNQLPPARRLEVMLRGANHYGFSDDGAMLKSPPLRYGLKKLRLIGMDGRRQLELTRDCVRSFLGIALRQTAAASDLSTVCDAAEIERAP